MTSAGPARRIPQLDGIRGIAILLVIFHNQGSRYPTLHLERLFANGWMGVDLFFVLSGFLITGILLDTKRAERYFTSFYVRRCFRTWPLYYVVIAFMFLVVPHIHSSKAVLADRSAPWWAYVLYLQNFFVAIPTRAVGPLGVTWSLAIEEQFYLVWPLFVRYCSAARLRQFALCIMCLSPVLRLYLSLHGVDLYANVFCRLDGLMAGALIAVSARTPGFLPESNIRPAWILLFCAAPLAFVSEYLGARWFTFTLSAGASAAFVYLALFSKATWLRRVLSNRALVYIGTISYGLYLLHKIPFDAAEVIKVGMPPVVAFPTLLAACILLATLSWRFFERPILRFRGSIAPSGVAARAVSPSLPGQTTVVHYAD